MGLRTLSLKGADTSKGLPGGGPFLASWLIQNNLLCFRGKGL